MVLPDNLAIPVHLAVHVLGVSVALGIAVYGLARRRDPATAATTAWLGFVAGGLLLAANHVVRGGLLADGVWPVHLRTAAYAALAAGAVGHLAGRAGAGSLVPVVFHTGDAGDAGTLAGRLANWFNGGLSDRGAGQVVARRLIGGDEAVAAQAAGPVTGSRLFPDALLRAPPTATIAAAVAAAAGGVAMLAGRMRRDHAGGLLAGSLALWAVGDLIAASLLADIVTTAGSVTAGVWLLRQSRHRLLSRLMTSFLGVLLALVVAFAGLGAVVVGSDLQQDELDALRNAVEARTAEIRDDWTADSLRIARQFVSESLAREMIRGNTAALDGFVRDIAELPSVDIAMLLDGRGRVVTSFVRGVEPEGRPLPAGDSLAFAGDPVTTAALDGAATSGLVPGGDDGLVAAGASPIFPIEGGEVRRDAQTGVLFVARRAAGPTVVQEISLTAGAQATAVIGDTVAATTLNRSVAEALAGRVDDLVDDAGDGAADGAADGPADGPVDGPGTGGLVDVGDASLLVAGAPYSATDPAVGQLLLSEDATAVVAAQRRFTRALFVAALTGTVGAAVLAAWAARRTTRPLRRLTAASDRIAAGERDVSTDIDQPDEVGRLARSFDAMTTALTRRERELREVATAEAALRTRLEVLTSSMGEALVATDPGGDVQTVNPAAEDLLGVVADDAVDRPVGEVLAQAGAADLLADLGGADDREVRATRRTIDVPPRRRHVAATAAPLTGADGSHQGRVYVLRDVTGEAEAERMKTQFLANVSHELRTPLTPIAGYASVLRRPDVTSEEVAEFATNIVSSASRLERVIGMLVDFASLEAGRLDVRPEPTVVGDVVDEVLDRWRQRHPERRFSRRLARDLPRAHVDPDLLGRVLEELMDNAVKFSEGPVRVRAGGLDDGIGDGAVELAPRHGGFGGPEMSETAGGGRRHDGRGGNDRVRLTVSDDGIGIPEDELALITRDFHQVDGTATRQYGGLGLGLSLVARIAERVGARVVIDSAPDAGTQVHLLLPVADEALS